MEEGREVVGKGGGGEEEGREVGGKRREGRWGGRG